MAAIKWGMICSVSDDQPLDVFREFGEWLTQTLEKEAHRLHLTHRFRRDAKFIMRCTPDDKDSMQNAYEEVRKNHADVLYVIHILPKANSMEFTMLKQQLSALNAIVGQGILAEKAISRFEGASIDAVIDSLNQFISQRLAQLTSRHREENTYRMYVRGRPVAVQEAQQDDFTEEITRVLHAGSKQVPTKVEEIEYDDRVVCVSGFPVHFDESQVLSIFGRFIPRFVRWLSEGTAVVEFENWIQAAQAVALYHRKVFRNSQLLVVPCDTQVARLARELMCPVDPDVTDDDLGEIPVDSMYAIISKLEGACLSDDASDSLSDVSEELSSDGELSDATVVEVVRKPLTVQGQ